MGKGTGCDLDGHRDAGSPPAGDPGRGMAPGPRAAVAPERAAAAASKPVARPSRTAAPVDGAEARPVAGAAEPGAGQDRHPEPGAGGEPEWASTPPAPEPWPHIPVLLEAVLAYLAPQRGGRFVDGTVGAGGHAAAILEAAGPAGQLLGIDRDPRALELARARLAPYGERVRLVRGDFRDLDRHLAAAGWEAVDGILLDLGVSSMQLDDPARGFSYQVEAPLDMRMDPSQRVTAADLVNTASRDQLARWIADYGEERWAGRIADFIVAARRRRPITTTTQLVEVIKDAIPARARRRGGHPARRTFQALRIAVNRELDGLQGFLEEAARRLRPGGRLVVISFHSLEDRAVKAAFRSLASRRGDAGAGGPDDEGQPGYRVLTRRPVVPGEEETRRNPRARSAKLRALERAGPEPVGSEPERLP
ncbi:16S rRNA (cytosine(1402)-N(4))-methyltransferase RsmH [Thermaerobacter litoralis]